MWVRARLSRWVSMFRHRRSRHRQWWCRCSVLLATVIAVSMPRRTHTHTHTHSARQMLTFIESICPQDRNLLFFIFISFMVLVDRYLLGIPRYRNPKFHICRILFYESEKQCRKSSPVCVCVHVLRIYTSMWCYVLDHCTPVAVRAIVTAWANNEKRRFNVSGYAGEHRFLELLKSILVGWIHG